STANGQWGVSVRRVNLCSHRAQWRGDALHRAARQTGVADQDAREPRGSEEPGQQPHRRSGVPAIQRRRGGLESLATLTLDLKGSTEAFADRRVPRGTATLHPGATVASPDLEGRSSTRGNGRKAGCRRADVEGCRKVS